MLGLVRTLGSLISLNRPALPLSWIHMSHKKPQEREIRRDTRLLPPLSPFHMTPPPSSPSPHKQYESICLEHFSGCLKHTYLSPWQIPPSEEKIWVFLRCFYFMFIPSLSLNFYLPASLWHILEMFQSYLYSILTLVFLMFWEMP